MKKAQLLGMKELIATPYMMKMAEGDEPFLVTRCYYPDQMAYCTGLYMRALVQDCILKVAFFLPEQMRSGKRNPAYVLYVDRDNEKFLTYNALSNKWQNSMLSNISWPRYVRYSNKRIWITKDSKRVILNYLGGGRDGYSSLQRFQLTVRAHELERRHKRETDPWDKDLEQVPDLPKDWNRWVDKVAIPENYIFYTYTKKGATSGYCTYCEKDVPIKNPRYNATGRCTRCRHEVTFKSLGRVGFVDTGRSCWYLMQRCRDGFIVRMFYGQRRYRKGEHKHPQVSCHETRRIIYPGGGMASRTYYWGLYKLQSHRWIRGRVFNGSCYGTYEGMVYGKTVPTLAANELQRTGLPEALAQSQIIDPELYLSVLRKHPVLERLAKAGLRGLVDDYLAGRRGYGQYEIDEENPNLTKALDVNKQELKRLRDNRGGFSFLQWMRYEKQSGKPMKDSVIRWCIEHKICQSVIEQILDRMSATQVHNYLRRQMKQNNATSSDILSKWFDYLSMAERLGLDTSDAIIYRVNKLYQRHDELVERCNQKALEQVAKEILNNYPHVNDICQSLKKKYEFANEDYTVLVPDNIVQIILEGRYLSHCMGNSEYYWERIESRESYVLFLRKTAEVDVPYYTLEVEPDGTIRQKRTFFDRQEKNLQEASSFLRKWQREIAGRLTQEDRELANRSRVLRKENFVHLQETKKIINYGDLQGQLLVNVLMADLMEAAA